MLGDEPARVLALMAQVSGRSRAARQGPDGLG
jgi:hypothetical protein